MTQDPPVIMVADRMRDMSLVSNPSKFRHVYRHGRRVKYTLADPKVIGAIVGRYARVSVYHREIYLHLGNGTAEDWRTKIPAYSGEIYLHLANGGAEDYRTKIPAPPPAYFIVRPGEYWIAGPFKTDEIPAAWLGSYSAGDPLPADWVTAETPDPAVASARPLTPEDFIGRI